MPSVFRWILWPAHELLVGLWDEFLVGTFHIRVAGTSLEVEGPESADAPTARAVAERYLEVLRNHLIPVRLMTVEEFAALPPPMMQVISPARGDRARVRRAIRLVRNELLESRDPHLRRVYDYVQIAREKEQDGDPDTLFYLYKAIETIENALGGEAAACDLLNVRAELKSVKHMANEQTSDERHAPRDPSQPGAAPNRALASQQTLVVVRAYERYTQR